MLKRFTLFVFCSLILNTASAGSDRPDNIYWQEDFNSFFKSSFASALNHSNNADIVFNLGPDQSKALRVDYQGFERGSKRVIENLSLDNPTAAAWVAFDVKFCANFDFARGGKLHGFFPVNPVTGGHPIKPDGWSARAMWGKQGQLKSYIYHQQMKGRYGDVKVAKNFHFEAGRYYRVKYELVLNQPATAANGSLSIFVDGKRQVLHQGLQFRAVEGEQTLINQFSFNTFHGGNDPSWAPRNAEGGFKKDCAYFDNFVVGSLRQLKASE